MLLRNYNCGYYSRLLEKAKWLWKFLSLFFNYSNHLRFSLKFFECYIGASQANFMEILSSENNLMRLV